MNDILARLSYSNNNFNDDLSLIPDTGRTFVISNKLLGRGSYGNVYLANDEHGKKVAVKCCKVDNNGIPNILETSIMATTIHPYLNRALRIHAIDTKIYIIMELAVTDLSKHTNRNKGNYRPTSKELISWCYSLSQAVNALHQDNIIHADIKASNVLLYEDGTVRLTDYTLATKKWKADDKFIHNVCTCTHRPLECLTNKQWDKSLDIWSLGCTFYEIAYGKLLFPHQDVLEHKKDKDDKIRLRQRATNAIIDWSIRHSNKEDIESLPDKFSIDHVPAKFCEEYFELEMKPFNELLKKMLVITPEARLSINEILSNPYFTGLSYPMYLSISRPTNKLSISEQARVVRYIETYTNKEGCDNILVIRSLALKIYCSCNDMSHINESVRAGGSVWIASKLVIGVPLPTTLSLSSILAVEREICHNLLFRLHQ